MQGRDFIGEITHMAIGPGILEDRAKDGTGIQVIRIGNHHVDAQWGSACLDHGNGLGVAVLVDKKGSVIRLGTRPTEGHGHGLGGGGGLVQQGGIGDIHAGQVADHSLEVQQRFKPTLRNLGLVGRIGGVPGRVFQDVAQNRCRRGGAVIALTDQ
jgi:hypothetical protein